MLDRHLKVALIVGLAASPARVIVVSLGFVSHNELGPLHFENCTNFFAFYSTS